MAFLRCCFRGRPGNSLNLSSNVSTLLDTVNYNWSNPTPGTFSGVLLNGVPTTNNVTVAPTDYLEIRANFLFTVDRSSLTVNTVPEPATGLLLMICAGALIHRRRRGD